MEGNPLPEEQSHPTFEWNAERLWPQFARLADAEPDAPTYQNYGAAHASSSDSRRRAVALWK